MKVRVTLMTENDTPIETLGDNPEEKILTAWKAVCKMLTTLSDGDKATVESIEIVDRE